MAARLVAEHGTPQAAADAVWALARENEWYREGEGAERFLLAKPDGVAPVNKAALNLLVAWHGDLVGRLTHDGFEWRWKPERRTGPALIRETIPGKLPAFIELLLPEGWLAQVLHERDERMSARTGAPLGFPTPFEAVMGQPTDQIAVPGDQKIERGLVHRRDTMRVWQGGSVRRPRPPLFVSRASAQTASTAPPPGHAVFRHQPGTMLGAHLRRNFLYNSAERLRSDGDRRRGVGSALSSGSYSRVRNLVRWLRRPLMKRRPSRCGREQDRAARVSR